ncbi:MAG: phosphatidylserine decarboxylase, partial [Gluconacetobacter diazotrophicus]|nr:phosphatidylserine decarboxylase [Gluconacetobacter diazotrophicus]
MRPSRRSRGRGIVTIRRLIAALVAAEELNFLLTNRVPRRLLTRLVGRVSRIEHPAVARAGIALWRLFTPLDLSEAESDRFPSIGACFTRRLRDGARPFDPRPGMLASPCDAIVGVLGQIEDGRAWQIKGAPYRLEELLGDAALAAELAGASYCTLRLTSAMYHRFHAPAALVVEGVRYLSGDCFNVNTPALKRVERLFCRNERAVLRCRLPDGSRLVIVAVAAILVAGIRLR